MPSLAPPAVSRHPEREIMLHALLHNKLDETIPEPKRLEDAVTSTVFGTLLLGHAENLLAQWLVTARALQPTAPPWCPAASLRGCWFWPRLPHAEPDVVLWLGDDLVVIEAKVGSGRHDRSAGIASGDEPPITDQLCRQWACVSGGGNVGSACPGDLARAVQQARPRLVYLVDERRSARARREVDESAKRLPPGADLRLLTWQSLHRLLVAGRADAGQRLAGDLRLYMERIGLAGFVGFRSVRLPVALAPLIDWIPGTARAGDRAPLGFLDGPRLCSPVHHASIRSFRVAAAVPGRGVKLAWGALAAASSPACSLLKWRIGAVGRRPPEPGSHDTKEVHHGRC